MKYHEAMPKDDEFWFVETEDGSPIVVWIVHEDEEDEESPLVGFVCGEVEYKPATFFSYIGRAILEKPKLKEQDDIQVKAKPARKEISKSTD